MSSEVDYPEDNLTPKRETGVLSFLNKYPHYDGRGTVIVVMDSGTDCSVDGLQRTSTGLPKIIERYDCTGDGDVDTSTKVTQNSDGMITGVDGTLLKIPEDWENPSGEYHVGIKPLYELYITKLRERVEERRKEENWEKAQALASAKAVTLSPLNNNPGGNGNQVDKFEKEEAEAKLEALDLLEKKYKDWGPLVHCILFRDKSDKWRIALSLTPDLGQVELLGEYSLDQSYIHMTNEDKLTISVNVWENGNRLEIVSMCSSHGTHVAAIAAGYFPDNPALNGVAPGAQVISLTIGNGRLGSMESASAISRAAAFLQRNSHRLTVVNMSYGEHAHWSSCGRVGELMRETVDKYGLIWVVSAGNHGPALSTVGTPPWICANNLIGVGAYVSPEMMVSEYCLSEKLSPMPYTWSSRGPTLDGDIGVSVAAPGGAITSVPSFTERSNQLMNGTSMASPHVAGIVALLASAANDMNLRYSPYSMKRALEGGASKVEGADPLSVGAGLVQVEPSLLKLEQFSSSPERDVRFNICVGGTGFQGKGIYIRDLKQGQKKDYQVTVEPVFFKSKSMDIAQKIEFSLNLVLVSNASWVIPPSFLQLSNAQRAFMVRVDLDGLVGLQHAKVEAFDTKDPRRGPVFTLHVTAAVPLEPKRVVELPVVAYEAGLLKRHFLSVPRGATQAVLSLKNQGVGGCRMVVHAVTLVQGQCCKSEEFYKVLTLAPGEDTTLTFKVLEEKVIEVVIGRWWSEPKTVVPIAAQIVFKSLTVDVPEIHVSATDSFVRVNVGSLFQTEEITPTVSLKNQVCLLRASSVKLLSLTGERDTFPGGKIVYELISTYGFTINRPTTVQINCSLLSDTLYEGDYESQLWMMFDNCKRMVGAGDAYPAKWPIKLEKGDYTLKLQIRHEKRELLEKFVNGYPNFQGEGLCPTLPVLLVAKLQTNIALGVHQSAHDLQVGKKGTGWSTPVKKGTVVPIYIATNIVDKNLKQLPCNQATHYFSGSLTLQKDEKREPRSVRLFMPESAGKLKAGDKTKEDLMDQMRDIKTSWMGKTEKEESKKLYNELVATSPTYLSIYTTRIGALELVKKEVAHDPDALNEIQSEIKELIEKVCSLVDKNELLLYFGSKNPNPDPKLKTSMEKNRSAYVEVLVKKGLLFPDEIKSAWTEATNFFDPADSRVIELSVKEALERGHYGRAARYLLKSEDTSLDKDKDKDKRLLEIFEKLDWAGAVWLWKENIQFKNALKDYRLF